MIRKTVNINFKGKTNSEEISCQDGEVAAHVGLSWLEQSGMSERKSADSKVNFQQKLLHQGVVLAQNSELLAVHAPISTGKRYLIYRKDLLTIGYREWKSEGINTPVGNFPRSIGKLIAAYPYGNFVTFIGSSGLAWLLYDVSSETYSLLTSLPEPPDVDFSLDDAYLEGYTQSVGLNPIMDVEVDLKDVADLIEAEALNAWFTHGHSSRVDEGIKRLVFESVGKRVAIYSEDVRNAGLFLMPVSCYAAFGTSLPSQRCIVTPPEEDIYAKLLSWNLSSKTLSLKLAFSLRPKQLSACFTLSALQLNWAAIFPTLNFYLSESPSWFSDGGSGSKTIPIVTGLFSLSPVDNGFAFRFRTKNAGAINYYLNRNGGYKLSRSIVITGSTGGTILLFPPDSSGDTVVPDYRDFLPVKPAGAALTEEGIILWTNHEILSPVKENGLVYRYHNQVCNAKILGVVSSMGRRHTGKESRHPLFLLCNDGIRLLEEDGNGGYMNIRFISMIPLDNSRNPLYEGQNYKRFTTVGSNLWYLSSRGVETVTSAGTATSKASFPQDFDVTSISKIYYEHTSVCLIIVKDDTTHILYDIENDKWINSIENPVVMIQNPLESEGRLLGLDLTNEIVIWENKRTEAVEMERLPIENEDGPNDFCGLITRALKLGDPYKRKRIRSLTPSIPAEYTIEGSDDLMGWRVLSRGVAPCKGLHMISCRYHRIRLIVTPDVADKLTGMSLQYVL